MTKLISSVKNVGTHINNEIHRTQNVYVDKSAWNRLYMCTATNLTYLVPARV